MKLKLRIMKWTAFRLSSMRASSSGYGLALLMVFIASTVLVGTSLQFLAGPSSMAYLGQASQDNLAARQVAALGLDAARTDIQSKLNNSQAVTTSYRFPSSGTTAVTIPSYPGSGSNVTIGDYYVTVSQARGNTYVLKSNATANGSSYQLSKLIQISRNNFILDGIPNATAAYSLRRLRTAYAGSAIRVRRASDNTEQDIGFTPVGDLDVNSLLTFLGGGTAPPLDTVTGATAAYGLRRLRSAYFGSAIRVRRSSDNAEQDIGFYLDGSLNVGTLMDFVGSDSGYISTWYDQSGNGYNAAQTTTANQPRIINAGTLETLNNRPAIRFIAANTTYLNAGSYGNMGFPSGFTISFTTANPSGNDTFWRGIVERRSVSATDSFAILKYDSSKELFVEIEGDIGGGKKASITNSLVQGNLLVGTATFTSAASLTGHQNGTLTQNNAGIVDTLAASTNSLYIGARYGLGTDGYDGHINEIYIYPSALSSTNRALIEKSQSRYYGISQVPDGFITTWYDQSGGGNNVTQATQSLQPMISVKGEGATSHRPTVAFNGAQGLGSATGMPTNSDYSKSAVFTYNNASSVNNIISSTAGTAHAFYMNASSYLRLWHNGLFATSSTAASLKTPYAVLGTFTNSSLLGTLYQGNVSVGTGTAASANTVSNVSLGYHGGGNYLSGSISEAIIFSRIINSTERTQVYSDQQAYYGAQ